MTSRWQLRAALVGLHQAATMAGRMVRSGSTADASKAANPVLIEGVALAPATVFVSACVDAETPGGWRYNGGIKEYNMLAKLLRQQGHSAYVVTYDGSYQPWLIEHQPTVSISEMQRIAAGATRVRYVTSWAIAKTFLSVAKHVHFWDMELHYTSGPHYAALSRLYRGKVASTAAISRTIQAWHMASFGRRPTLLPNLIDLDVWTPDPASRQRGRIGYMNEGSHTTAFVEAIRDALSLHGKACELVQVSGDEQSCLQTMRTCSLFLNLNVGKDPLWGEGCPRTIIESMAAGCVNVSFDIVGNREIAIDGYNAVVVAEPTAAAMAAAVVGLLSDSARLEQFRAQSAQVLQQCHRLSSRWPAVQRFLSL